MISGSVERERRLQESEPGLILAGAKATEHFRQIPIADLVRFAIETTMRRSEITRLQWSDLDEKNRTILIRDRKDPKKKIGNDRAAARYFFKHRRSPAPANLSSPINPNPLGWPFAALSERRVFWICTFTTCAMKGSAGCLS